MLLDNENENLKVHEWLSEKTKEGTMSIVTGYFTVGALAYLAKKTQEKISAYRFILGDIVNVANEQVRSLDLLNEEIGVEAALRLSNIAREAVDFLKLDKVKTKTLEPNFCHAKLYLFKDENNDAQNNYYISGSSNLTEAGIGLKITNNVELNFADFGANKYSEFAGWFENLWNRPQAHKEKTVYFEDSGKKREKKVDFKQYLIEEICKIFKEYSPNELYYKVLFELFWNDLAVEQNNADFNMQIGRLENSRIFTDLHDFQKKGALSLIKMLQRYNGAILADAVGLGKTWTALAVMKFYQLQGREIILICPKKLNHNWIKYLKRHNSRFEKDEFDYLVIWHSELSDDLLGRRIGLGREYFTNNRPKLFVVDESHNLRNDKTYKYKYLTENILAKNGDCKILMLSATPINNTLLDIRNQFKLIVAGNDKGFSTNLEINSIDGLFKDAQKKFNDWIGGGGNNIKTFTDKLHPNFFKLTDSLTVARTRKMVESLQPDLVFPHKETPDNIFVTPRQIGNIEKFGELLDHFPPMLSGYQPAAYVKTYDKSDVLHNEKLRQFFLVKMMYILLVKRLESSWFSFQSTVKTILDHHQNAFNKILNYEHDQNAEIAIDASNLNPDDDFTLGKDDFTLGKGNNPIRIADIAAAGNIEYYREDLKKDIEKLESLLNNLAKFENQIEREESADTKLQILIEKIQAKQRSDNKKILIFTTYTDTATYLFDKLKQRGYTNLAFVGGDSSKVWNETVETKNFETILERFAPYTKLYKDKKWDGFVDGSSFEEWKQWINSQEEYADTQNKLQNPIDILIATDVLSEGQNLQDCDMVVNYDIHWNPVRIIQRLGRIDRLGSPNRTVYTVNFFPSENINTYLGLQRRIEVRMALMTVAGAEVPEFTEALKRRKEDEELEQRQNNRMLEQMQTTLEDIETEKSFGFDELSLETFRQDLLNTLKERQKYYQSMPDGIYTGFKIVNKICPGAGIIALLKYRNKTAAKPYELVYIGLDGKEILNNQKEILSALASHKDESRFVPEEIERGDETTIRIYAQALSSWITAKAGPVAEAQLNDILEGNINTANVQLERTEEKFQANNFDLITWFVISNN
ncbi:MAG: phospholipase D-like domain-containing protein [Prevotellaceae bacterium]|jgi:ERCC4-related helicase|nr:phospholipase D-like domain-containing protein [Prevotellaceae bacterium]